MNKRRKTIYAERDKVLHNEDLTETIRGFLDGEIESLLAEHLAAAEPDDWDMDGLPRARPPRLPRRSPPERLPQGGLRGVRGAARLHPAPGRLDDLPRQRDAPAGDHAAARARSAVAPRGRAGGGPPKMGRTAPCFCGSGGES